MLEDEDFYNLINKKIVNHSELVVLFFEDCNLNCIFCPQNHTSEVGADRDSILAKVPGIVNYINNNPSLDFYLHIMGGELFQDKFIEKDFLIYYGEFIDLIKNQVQSNKKLHFCFITNLVYNNIDAVINFCEKYNLKMSVSYDMNGRFNMNQLNLFKENIEKISEHIRLISLVITKQNIISLIKGDEYFDYLYSKYLCSWDKMLPSVGFNDHLMPKESELLEFYKILADKYPLCTNMESFLSDSENAMTCTRGNSYTVMADGSKAKGCSGTVLLNDTNTPKKHLESTIIMQKYISQKNCFSCEYYSKCSFSCFINNEYKNMVRDIDGCVFKEVFKYVESKKKSQNSVY